MSSFEYVMVLVSIIMGLAITTILAGSVRVLQAGSGMKPGLLHTLWVLHLLIAMVGLWATRWNTGRRDEWSGPVMLLFLVLPVIYYAMAELLFPAPGRTVRLNDHFLDNRRGYFGLLTLTSLAGVAGPYVFYPRPPNPGSTVILLSLIPGFVFFAISRNERLHIAWAIWVLLVYLLGLATSTVG